VPGGGRQDGKALSASQVRATHTVLSGALKQAVAWGWIAHNPARLATPPSMPHGEVVPPPRRRGSRAWWRSAAARLTGLARLRTPMIRLRRQAVAAPATARSWPP
jgi:hypothetical protein